MVPKSQENYIALNMLYFPKDETPLREADGSQKELADRREADREQTHSGAYIVCQGNAGVLDCRILDLSPKGARLWVEDTAGVPKFFELHTPEGEAFLCELKRRKADHIGVEFLERT
jgi:hypothetical protein